MVLYHEKKVLFLIGCFFVYTTVGAYGSSATDAKAKMGIGQRHFKIVCPLGSSSSNNRFSNAPTSSWFLLTDIIKRNLQNNVRQRLLDLKTCIEKSTNALFHINPADKNRILQLSFEIKHST